MIKKVLFFFFFFFSIHCHSDPSEAPLTVHVYKGEICSIIISTDTISKTVSLEESIDLIGTGDNSLYLGELTMAIFNNQPATPYQLDLISSTYNATKKAYVAENGTAELIIGISKNFDVNGGCIPYTLIDPTTNPITLRLSSTIIIEQHVLLIYILEDADNLFINGTYTASFTLYFSTP